MGIGLVSNQVLYGNQAGKRSGPMSLDTAEVILLALGREGKIRLIN
jgi:hypothetical protein